MTSSPSLRPFATAIDARDWEALRTLLAPDFRALFVQDGRTFYADSFVAFQRDYPGRWRFEVVDHLAAGDRAVTRARVSDGTKVFYVASFATFSEGLLNDLVEVWTDVVTGPEGSGD